ncbi:aspartyl-phosphate phosphatase Spo0E family protein [Ureibacillus sinduriensis]|uniref:aspartyl-phosphate phosphatase Spo0E family protein n=1 Tax=Ureibacillus sinduriensis TaxID=561440 RepID=UPI00056204FD|nr:aspartyl-phosphate phosphatase Spo0E family protein [Ureibacillus sinduriensis]
MAATFLNCDNLEKIQVLRTELIESGMKDGLNHPTTIKLSQTLDKVLNEYLLICGSATKTN